MQIPKHIIDALPSWEIEACLETLYELGISNEAVADDLLQLAIASATLRHLNKPIFFITPSAILLAYADDINERLNVTCLPPGHNILPGETDSPDFYVTVSFSLIDVAKIQKAVAEQASFLDF